MAMERGKTGDQGVVEVWEGDQNEVLAHQWSLMGANAGNDVLLHVVEISGLMGLDIKHCHR